jgi:hypothetical protein
MLAPQPSSAQAPGVPGCESCIAYGMGQPLHTAISVSEGAELAHFGDAAGVGTDLVYFVVNVSFSRAPANFTADQIAVANGGQHHYILEAVLDVLQCMLQGCLRLSKKALLQMSYQ